MDFVLDDKGRLCIGEPPRVYCITQAGQRLNGEKLDGYGIMVTTRRGTMTWLWEHGGRFSHTFPTLEQAKKFCFLLVSTPTLTKGMAYKIAMRGVERKPSPFRKAEPGAVEHCGTCHKLTVGNHGLVCLAHQEATAEDNVCDRWTRRRKARLQPETSYGWL